MARKPVANPSDTLKLLGHFRIRNFEKLEEIGADEHPKLLCFHTVQMLMGPGEQDCSGFKFSISRDEQAILQLCPECLAKRNGMDLVDFGDSWIAADWAEILAMRAVRP